MRSTLPTLPAGCRLRSASHCEAHGHKVTDPSAGDAHDADQAGPGSLGYPEAIRSVSLGEGLGNNNTFHQTPQTLQAGLSIAEHSSQSPTFQSANTRDKKT